MASTQETKNDKAWSKLFEKYNILQEINGKGTFIISSTQINEFREARLMTKFDNTKTLPKLFKDNNLTILPISANNYILGRFELYKEIPKIETPIEFKQFPTYIQSIDCNKINSETIALNCASISKILEDFLEEDNTEIVSTVAGKMSSGTFKFNVDNIVDDNTHSIKVDRSGIEIDAGYETSNSLVLIEAKNVIADDFLVRQLYYPFRLWREKVSKKVRNIFMQYTNGIFNLYEYEFIDYNNYNSLELVKSKRYSIINPDEMSITIDDILKIHRNISYIEEPKIPFPQANSFERIISLLEMLNTDNVKSKEEITDEFNFDPRQTDYYFNAGKYLGFLEEDTISVEENDKIIEKIAIKLSSKGKKLFYISYKQRQLEFVKSILEHKVFDETFREFININGKLQKEKIIEYMKNNNLYNVKSDATYVRRASTILGWTNWIIKICE